MVKPEIEELAREILDLPDDEDNFCVFPSARREEILLRIKNVDVVDFMIYVWRTFPPSFSDQFFFSLPELMDELFASDFSRILRSLDHNYHLVDFVGAMHKYWNISLWQETFEEVLIDSKGRTTCLKHALQFCGAYFIEPDREMLDDREYLVGWEDFSYNKLRFSLDKEIIPAFKSHSELLGYLEYQSQNPPQTPSQPTRLC